MRRKVFLIVSLLIIVLVLVSYFLYREIYKKEVSGKNVQIEAVGNDVQSNPEDEKSLPVVFPDKTISNVPFTCQAPFANWDVHENSCEEAAILMPYYYFEGKTLTPQIADSELRAMVLWETKNWGPEKDLTCDETLNLIKTYYNYQSCKVVKNITPNDIRKQIYLDNLVIVPVMTQPLHNPNYRPRDVYHMVLIKGYDSTGVITNDAGIKEGENWHYSWDVIFGAIDAQSATMNQGREMIVFKK